MASFSERLADWIGEIVVLDCHAPFVAIGTLAAASSESIELTDADLHDLRDTETSRELYVVKTARHGVAFNRKRVLLRSAEVVAVAKLDDVVAG
ncbi:MAG TPA: hypothetical protein VNC50_07740 [Planctomycetia bacterium]|nr:hypothetical protein [Planctomycetia bacterium]